MGLIDKEYFIGAMEESKRIHGEYSVSINNFINSLKSAPTVDAEPVRHGHWIAHRSGKDLQCSECEWSTDFPIVRKYCPHCGAKMDEEVPT